MEKVSRNSNKFQLTNDFYLRMIEHDHTFSTYTYCNFNQFTQRNLNDAYQNLPDVVPTPSKPFVETPVDM